MTSSRLSTALSSLADRVLAAVPDHAVQDEVLTIWEGVAAELEQDRRLRQLLATSFIPLDQRSALVALACPATAPAIVSEIIIDLMKMGALHELPRLLRLIKAAREKRDLAMDVVIHTPSALTAMERQELEQALTKKFKLPVRMTEHLEPALIGGIEIHHGSHVMDYSLRGRLDRLAAALTA